MAHVQEFVDFFLEVLLVFEIICAIIVLDSLLRKKEKTLGIIFYRLNLQYIVP